MSDDTPRILPNVTPQNEFFWTAGSDGVLRVQKCESCESLVHPPKPACPYCRSTRVGVTDLSGKASLFGYTVNHRFTLPGTPSPYIVAEVALAEDPRTRLTTRLVDADADELHHGMPVEVVFEQCEDVWLPLFRPDTDSAAEVVAPPADAIDPADFAAHVRPMVTTKKFEDEAVLSGVGASRIGRRLMVDPLALTVEACERAVADAGLTMDDIDGLATYPGGSADSGFSEGGITALEATLRIRPTWYAGGAETFGPSGSVINAMMAVSAGLARHVLCFRTLWQSSQSVLAARNRSGGSSRASGNMAWTMPFGGISAAHTLAQTAHRYFDRFGATKETLGWIAINQRANAALHPTAIYREPLTMDDYMSARTITTPFGLYDCDVPCDASIAVVVSAADTANDLAQPPVRVEAVGTQLIERLEWDQSTSTHEPQVFGPAAHLWTRTDLRPDDVDFAELYDGFTINCISWLEGLGFCGIGEAKDFLDGGRAIARDGDLPLNTNGGQLSHGRTHGMGLLAEAIEQLRGQAGERQVADARVGVVSSGGLTPGGVLLLRAGD